MPTWEEWTKTKGWEPMDPADLKDSLEEMSKEELIKIVVEQRANLIKKQKDYLSAGEMITGYQNDIDKKNAEIVSLKSHILTLTNSLAVAKDDIDALETANNKKSNKLEALSTSKSYYQKLSEDFQKQLDNTPDNTKEAVKNMLIAKEQAQSYLKTLGVWKKELAEQDQKLVELTKELAEQKKLYAQAKSREDHDFDEADISYLQQQYDEMSAAYEQLAETHDELKARWSMLNTVVHDSHSVGPLTAMEWVSLRYQSVDHTMQGFIQTPEQAQALVMFQKAVFNFLRAGAQKHEFNVLLKPELENLAKKISGVLNDPRLGKLWSYYMDGKPSFKMSWEDTPDFST